VREYLEVGGGVSEYRSTMKYVYTILLSLDTANPMASSGIGTIIYYYCQHPLLLLSAHMFVLVGL
jgi:hypothetical protein